MPSTRTRPMLYASSQPEEYRVLAGADTDLVRAAIASEVHPVVEWRTRRDPVPDLDEFSGLVVGGSPSAAYAMEPWIRRLQAVVIDAMRRELPLLGICFGAQILARSLGGKVRPSTRGFRVGNHRLRLRAEAANDPLFFDLPREIDVLLNHGDIIDGVPPRAILLACLGPVVQAFRVAGCPAWAVQFHPEFTPDFLRCLEPVARTAWPDRGFLETLAPTPAARSLLPRFLQYCRRSD